MKQHPIFSAPVSADMDDIVFEKRNKQYGAYYLRRQYGHHIREALLFTFLFVAFIVLAIQWATILRDRIIYEPPVLPQGEVIVLQQELPDIIVDKRQLLLPESENTQAHKKIVTDSVPELSKEEVDTTSKATTNTADTQGTGEEGNDTGSEGLSPLTGTGLAGITSGLDTGGEKDIKDVADERPSFVGGDNALKKYLSNKIRFTEIGELAGASGKVTISFVVSKSGEITDVKILDDRVGYGCAELAREVVRNMPRWNPGKDKGETVNFRMILPVVFSQ